MSIVLAFILECKSADQTLLSLIIADTFVVLGKTTTLHNLNGRLVFRKADTGNFRNTDLFHDNR